MKLTVLVLATALAVGLIGLGCSTSTNNIASAKPVAANPATSRSASPAQPATPAQPASPITMPTPDDVPRISLADAKKAFDSKAAIFVDTHSKQTFDAEHIAGAINMTTGEVGTAADKLPKGKKIIAYCS